MNRNNLRRIISCMTAVALTMTFSVTAFAGGGPDYPIREEVTENIYPERDEGNSNQEMAPPLTPSGNLTLVDDIRQEDKSTDAPANEDNQTNNELENKQFITVQSKNGNYFYLVIDRSGETENVYFLNMVDESDLLALIEEPTEDAVPVCICEEQCTIGSIERNCEICAYNISDCAGVEPTPDLPEEPDEPIQEPADEPQKPVSKNQSVALVVIVLALFGLGSFFLYKRYIQPKYQTKLHPDPDAFEYDDENEDEEEL